MSSIPYLTEKNTEQSIEEKEVIAWETDKSKSSQLSQGNVYCKESRQYSTIKLSRTFCEVLLDNATFKVRLKDIIKQL